MAMTNPHWDYERSAALKAVAKLRRDDPEAHKALKELACERFGNDNGSSMVTIAVELNLAKEVLT